MPENNVTKNMTSLGRLISNTGRGMDGTVKLIEAAGVKPALNIDGVQYFDAESVDKIMQQHRNTPVTEDRKRELLNASPEGARVLRDRDRKSNQ